MTNEELILQRLDSLESQISPLVKSATELKELKDDIIPLGNTAVQLLIQELQEVEAGFQLEDLFLLIKQVMRNTRNFSFALRQMENIIEFVTDLEPLLKSAVPLMIDHLDTLERKGVFRILQATLDVRAKVAEAYTAEDIDKIGDGAVAMMALAKKMGDPNTLGFLEKAIDMLPEIKLEKTKKVGPLGLVSAGFNSEIKQGLGVLMQLTKALGKLSNGNDASDGDDGKEVLPKSTD
ncbi:MAG: DUF1641 domain-containing protein [Deltaproteobacteria bacterium]|nr:DUF1641 domain-containing protein [Deltaproteobacteria bacterium]